LLRDAGFVQVVKRYSKSVTPVRARVPPPCRAPGSSDDGPFTGEARREASRDGFFHRFVDGEKPTCSRTARAQVGRHAHRSSLLRGVP
jgi:hypothetical protein